MPDWILMPPSRPGYSEQAANIIQFHTNSAEEPEKYFILVGTNRPENGKKSDFMDKYYPAEKINLEGARLRVIDQHEEAVGNARIFGWLCLVS